VQGCGGKWLSEGFGQQTGGAGHKVVAGVVAPLALQQLEAVQVAVFFAETGSQPLRHHALVAKAAYHGHAGNAAAGLAQAGDAAAERRCHHGSCWFVYWEPVGKGKHYRLATVAPLFMQLAGFGYAFVYFVVVHNDIIFRFVLNDVFVVSSHGVAEVGRVSKLFSQGFGLRCRVGVRWWLLAAKRV